MEPSHDPISKETSDADLVAVVVQGDAAAFELLFKRHRQRVATIAGRFFQQAPQIEDVIQETFVKAYFGLSGFSQYKVDSFAHWLARIAFNSCYDELRKQSRKREQSFADFSDSERQELSKLTSNMRVTTVESAAINRDLAHKLLRLLSAEDRIVLVLLDVEGLSVAEIARLMDWSSAKVKIRAFRARTDLRRLLKKFL
ncbi:MAG TPA: sigma-70 family RNA polymerase sigma factor [Pyrinomonadaceae bacterium]|nr:sigma-70 family RNA polymerase sigma factor [Pyrinomonadaceae bacterium]